MGEITQKPMNVSLIRKSIIIVLLLETFTTAAAHGFYDPTLQPFLCRCCMRKFVRNLLTSEHFSAIKNSPKSTLNWLQRTIVLLGFLTVRSLPFYLSIIDVFLVVLVAGST